MGNDLIEVDESKSRSFYPWEELESIGDSFKTSNKNARQLVYAKNKANERKGLSERFKAGKQPLGHYIVTRIEDAVEDITSV